MTAQPAAPIRFAVIPGEFAICRLASQAPVPAWAEIGDFCSVTRTTDELSVVCRAGEVPPEVRADSGWALLGLRGPLRLDGIGVLRSILDPLAEAAVSVFVVSTYDTDYLLVKQATLGRALDALIAAGHVRVRERQRGN